MLLVRRKNLLLNMKQKLRNEIKCKLNIKLFTAAISQAAKVFISKLILLILLFILFIYLFAENILNFV